MATIKKTELLNLISSDRVSQAIDLLQDATRHDQYLHDQVIQLAGRYNRLEREQIQGTVSKSDMDVENNRISNALTSLARQLPENIDLTIPFDGTLVYSDENDKPLPPNNNSFSTPAESNETPTIPPVSTPTPPPTQTRNAVLIGVASLAAILLAVLFVPCPTSTQYIVFRIILALGAAGVASIIPGLFNLNNTMLTASGALGVFGLVYLVNPAKNFASDENCNKVTAFNFTANIRQDKIAELSEQYPSLENAQLELFLNNKWEDAPVQANGLADFKSIAPEFANKKVEARLSANFWKLKNDSILLKPNSSELLLVVPDGSLSKIIGKVLDANTGNPLSGVIVESLGVLDTSDVSGNFLLSIPLSLQRETYEVYATKTGYQPSKDGRATPATGQNMSILLEKNK